jgi:basic membrane protein A
MTRDSKRVRVWQLLAVLMAVVLFAAACGDDDDSGDGSTTTEAGDATDDESADQDEEASDDESSDDEAAAGECVGEVTKAAWVYVGPIGDAGWTKKHDDGRLAAEEAIGGCLETTFLESVAEGPESEAVFERLAEQGNAVIFGTSFGYMEPMAKIAESYPDVVFEHATGFTDGENLGTYFGAAEEARYLSGMAAGSVSEGTIGYVAAFPIPEVLRGINAFTLGAQSVNPDATVEVVWTSTWFDPVVEREAADSLLNGGVDVIAQHQDTPAPGEAAAEAGAFWVGYNDDMSRFAPDAWLTAPVWDWGPFYIDTIESAVDGSWESEQYYGNMADGLVNLSPVSDAVPEDVRAQIDEVAGDIIAGDFAPFDGPINDQAGNEVVAEGESPDLGALLGMEYFVEGVIGTIDAG